MGAKKKKEKEKETEKEKEKESNKPTPVPKSPISEEKSSNTFLDTNDSFATPRSMSLTLVLNGSPPGPGEFNFFAMFNGIIILEARWSDGTVLDAESLHIDLKDPYFQKAIADKPLLFLLRAVGGKGTKDPDPLSHPENRAGASVDLFPLILGEEEVFITANMVLITTGEITDCFVEVRAISLGTKDESIIPLQLTMISAHCLPLAKEGTVYLSAIGLNEVHKPKAINFHMSLSTPKAEKIVWASVNTAGYAANTAMSVPTEDMFIPNDLQPQNTDICRSVYWNAMKRVLVDPNSFFERLSSPFLIEVAGVPRTGKIDIRGRYMGLVDAKVLLEPGQMSVTVCAKLLFFTEANTTEHGGALLELPPVSAKASARETEFILDEYGHNAYAVIRFDLMESLAANSKLAALYETIGYPLPEGPVAPIDHLDTDTAPEESIIDVRRVRKEGGALAVHKELSGLACKGAIPMTQGIKRTAANRLLMRVRAMLKSFPPGECSYIDWQDTVTGQHAASRRAVTASFAPQPPPPRLPGKVAAARCRIAGDTRIADKHIKTNLKVAGSHPRSLISKTLRCLEERNDVDAKNYLIEALNSQSRNRYLLWILGGIEFDQEETADIAGAALRIAVKGEYSDGTANAIGWAALHAFHHSKGNVHAAFVAAKKMRKAFSLPTEWNKILERWTDTSGEEEIYWIPGVIASDNPILIAAAFFLCLRCYKLCERLLQCVEQDCAVRGSVKLKCKICPDVYYLRAASQILRRQFDSAMEMTLEGIKRFGPSPIMAQMRVTCLTCIRNWDRECDLALREAEKAGSELSPALLYRAALSKFKSDPKVAMQRVARAHKVSPSAYTALLIGRIYVKLGDEWLAERWLAAAVKTEPLLSDGWAMLSLLAMYEKNLDKAKIMLRTARQVGPVSPDIDEEVRKLMDIVQLDQMPDFLVKNICFCEHY